MIDIDFRSIRGYLPVIIGGIMLLCAAGVALVLVVRGGGNGQTNRNPTPISEATDPVTLAPTDTISPTEDGTPTLTATIAVTPTLEPYEYQVQEGDTLLFIIQQFGYRDQSIIPEVLRINGLSSENSVIQGQTLLIPRQTPTPGFTSGGDDGGGGVTTEDQDYSGCNLDNRCISPDGQYWVHAVQPEETVSGLAFMYDTTVQAIEEDNNLGQFISEGQILRIRIMVTLTPTLTPTGGPDSTATLTPTLVPPATVAPANGAHIARAEDITLQWSPIQPLQGTQVYRIIIRDAVSGEEVLRDVTNSNIYRLPEDLRPGTGGSVSYLWQISVVATNDPDSQVVGGEGKFSTFTWGN